MLRLASEMLPIASAKFERMTISNEIQRHLKIEKNELYIFTKIIELTY